MMTAATVQTADAERDLDVSTIACSVCGACRLAVVPGFAALPRVTSDARPWPDGGTLCACAACGAVQKPPTDAWLEETRRIYAGYEMYALSEAQDQAVFDAATGRSAPRAEHIARFLLDAVPTLPVRGRLLDVGCGPGGALATFARLLPGWRLDGYDLDNRNAENLRTIPGFGALFTDRLGAIDGRYDVVTLIHSLEHIPDPAATLTELRALLSPEGVLLIEVPNLLTSPFDLLIADHRSHFSAATLDHLVRNRSGLQVISLRADVLPKELTLLAAAGGGETARGPAPAPDRAGSEAAIQAVSVLHALLAAGEAMARKGEGFGLFGTSVSAMWLFGRLRENVDFFVDEDEARIGRRLYDRPIFHPRDVPKDSAVLVSLPPEIAMRIIDRLGRSHGRYVAPHVETA